MSLDGEDKFDDILTEIAKKAKNFEDVNELGKALEISVTDIYAYLVDNEGGRRWKGTLDMLRDWRKKQRSSTEKEALGHALEKIERIDLYEILCRMSDVDEGSARSTLSPDEELKKLRETLENYKPGQNTSMGLPGELPAVVNIGLFGVAGVGKSAFINSLKFAYKGEYATVAAEAGLHTMDSKTKNRTVVEITDHIHILDNRPMVDYSLKHIKDDLMPQICGKRGLDPTEKVTNGRVVHCPVLVCPIFPGLDDAEEFLREFSNEVRKLFGREIMLVVTNKEKQTADLEAELKRVNGHCGIPRDNMWVFENYTEDNREPDEVKNIQYLKFLSKSLNIAESNKKFQMEKSNENHPLAERIAKYCRDFFYQT